MRASIPQHPRNLPLWLSMAAWLAVFLSPTGYVLLLMIADRFQVSAPESFVAALFCLIPVMALLACGAVVWQSNLAVRWKVGWLVLTVLAMLFQVGIWFLIIVSAITAAIAPVQ